MSLALGLTQLPAPTAIRELDYEALRQAALDHLATLLPEIAPTLTLESEPVVKVTEVWAYMRLLGVADANDQVRAVLLPFATGADLDNLVSIYGIQRLVLTPAQPSALPPVAAVLETDDALRRRAVLALERFTTAGSRGAYEYWARSADGRVRDVSVVHAGPGQVAITVLSSEGDGLASADLIAAVAAACDEDTRRPLCDDLVVRSAEIVTYQVVAAIEYQPGPSAAVARAAAEAALAEYVAATHALGATVARSGIDRALHQPGVVRVAISSPAADIRATAAQAPRCTSLTLTEALP